MSCKRINIGQITGSGKERSTQSMSELLEKILEKKNMNEAYKKVCANKGAGGVDGMELEELDGFIRKNWNSIREQIRGRSYKPQPVRRVEIPKPNGSKRKLGIPTVMDRVIQQGIAQIISPMCEPLFSDHSYGFRPNRSCEMAIKDMLMFLNEGYEWIVDIDLEKFFDNVPQDKLMSLVHNIINDGDTESLIRKYLKAGVMVQGRYEKTEQGTPQGGNLTPLLSNIMLNELDKEMERRGLGFVRYADDCVIAVRSEASAKRVMYSITDWIERKLGLKVNADKTHITRPMNLKYLGFGFWKDSKTKEWKCRPHKDSVQKFKRTLKFAYKTASNNLETMESTEETAVGIAEAGYRKRPCKTDIIHGRPLSMDRNENLCSQGNLKRKAETGRACELLRLLHGTSCFEVMLNRRMPNGMYGGVRGEI